MIETEIGAFERAEIRYMKFGRRIVREARLKEFLVFHLGTILQQYAAMLALTDDQIADDQIGGRVGIELSSAPFQRQRGPLYTLHRRQFLRRHDSYEILSEMRRRIITSRNSLWRAIATIAFHKHYKSLAVTNSIRALVRDYKVITMLTTAIREYTIKHPEFASALYISKRRGDLLYPRLLEIDGRSNGEDVTISNETDDGESPSEMAEEYDDIDMEAMLMHADINDDAGEQSDMDNCVARWQWQRKHLWRNCSLSAPPGMLHPSGRDGLIEKFIYAIENIAYSPYAIRYTWEIFGGDEILSAKSLHAKLSVSSRLFEFGTSGAYLAMDRDQCGFISELRFDTVAAVLIFGEDIPADAEAALQNFMKMVGTALMQAAGKVTFGLPQERSLDQFRDLPLAQHFRRHWVDLKDVTGEVQMQFLFSEDFMREIE